MSDSGRERLKVEPARGRGSLLVLPYPGGRHPRIGFRDGPSAHRETKVSVSPLGGGGYAVADVPERSGSNRAASASFYLAHACNMLG